MNPISRIGCLVSAIRPDGEVEVFSYEYRDTALKLLEYSSSKFDECIRAGTKAALAQVDPAGEFDVELPIKIELKKAVRSSSLGVVFDFSEFTFRLRGVSVLARGCVTVCIGPKKSEAKDAQPEAYSKFWSRFMIVAPGQDQTVKQLRQFDRDCEVLGKAMLKSMEEPYLEVVRNLANDRSLKVECRPSEYRILATDAPASDFDELFDALRQGERLGDQLKKNDSARLLAQLGLAVIAGDEDPKLEGYEQGMSDRNIHVSIYDPADYYQGLLLKKNESNESRVVVGITQGPEFDESVEDAMKLRLSASNVVSVRLISNWGMRL